MGKGDYPVVNEPERRSPCVAIETLGCKLNQAESEDMARQLAGVGFIIVPAAGKADVFILNSCTVTQTADRKARHWLKMARKMNPSAFIIATGCYAERDPAALAGLGGVDLVLSNDEKPRLLTILAELGHIKIGTNPAPIKGGRTRSFIKIQDGCNNFCAYCIVPLVRGREKSHPPDNLIAEIKMRTAEGFREVVLTGTEVGRYSFGNLDLKGLLARILSETEVSRLRLSSLQPQEISPELVSLWQDKRLCPHFHLSLQSGSESVLRRMGRRYSASDYALAADYLRAAIPGAAVSTDVIAGFPGETEDEFKESCSFCAERHFSRLHVFQYSPREGTRAAAMPQQIPAPVKKQRSEALLALGHESLRDFNRGFISQTRAVLFEQTAGGLWTGLTENYIRVYCRNEADLTNRLLPVKLTEPRGEGLLGVPLTYPSSE
jgi:threonylcarbamoyladenosine tRNA methylthiotransferase MtaB